MFQVMAIAGVALSLLTPQAADPLTVPATAPAGPVTVTLGTVNGSGCPAGTTAVAAAPDNTAFTVTYSNYLAQAGYGAAPTDFRKNCQLGVLVHVPQGFTFAVYQVDYRGYASLARGATARQQANYYFQGSSSNSPVSHQFSGPMDDNWQSTDFTEDAQLVFAPCGAQRYLNINTELRVSKGSSTGTSFITMDSTDSSVSTVYHLSWKQC